MLRDALPKGERGDVMDGCFAVFTDPGRRVIASTHNQLTPGDRLELDPEFFALDPGEGVSNIVEYQGAYFVVGARASRGYREFKGPGDHYHNEVIALVFMKLGTVAEAKAQPGVDAGQPQQLLRFQRPRYPQPSGNELTTDISTFLIGGHLFGIESCNIVCSINDQEATPLVCSNPGFVGVFSYAGQTVGIVSLHALLGMRNPVYNAETDGILLVKVGDRGGAKDAEAILGIVIDRIMDSPEIPNRCIARYDSELAGKAVLTKAVVHPDAGDERATMLSILDIEALEERMLKPIGNLKGSELKLLGKDPQPVSSEAS